MYSIVDGKNKFTYPYSLTMNIIYDNNQYGNLEPQIKIIQDKQNKNQSTFRKNLLNNKNRYISKLIKEKESLENKNQRDKIELMINDAYDKYNNNIRNYSFNAIYNTNQKKSQEKLPILTKEKIKDEIISRSNKYFPKEYRNKNKQYEIKDIYNKISKEPNYKKLYQIKFIDTDEKDNEKDINSNSKFYKTQFNCIKPLFNENKRKLN